MAVLKVKNAEGNYVPIKYVGSDFPQQLDDHINNNELHIKYTQDTEPSSPTLGDIWLDISGTPYLFKRYDGTNFVNIGSVAPVDSVNGQTGEVVLDYSDVGAASKVEVDSKNATQDRGLAYLQLKQDSVDRIDAPDTFADDFNGNSFGMEFDRTITKSTEALSAGETVLSSDTVSRIGTIENGSFEVGQSVAVLDDTNTEMIDITRSETLSESTTNTVTDKTVVSSAYETSKNARPQVLDNGWIVSSVLDTTGSDPVYRLHVSKDDGDSWSELCSYTSSILNPSHVSPIATKGNIIYGILVFTGGFSYFFVDATEENPTMDNDGEVDSGQSSQNGVSLAISPDKTTLLASWASKNSTYPDSFNIRAVEGTINSDNTVTWGEVEQVTSVSSPNLKNPSSQYIGEVPSVSLQGEACFIDGTGGIGSSSSLYSIIILKRDTSFNDEGGGIHSSWRGRNVYYDNNNYSQSSPDLVTDKNGVLLCVWHGTDSNNTSYTQIKYASSSDNGETWSGMVNLTSGSTGKHDPSITVNDSGKVYVLYEDNTTGSLGIYSVTNDGTGWSSESIIKAGNTNDPTTFYDNNFSISFSEPLLVFQDNENTKVSFNGTWQSMKEQFYLEVDPLQNSYKSGAWIARSTMNEDGTFGKWDGNFTTNTVTDATVVNSAYDTSGNGGRKLVRLDNGWLVSALGDSSNGNILIYVDKIDGNGFSQLCFVDSSTNYEIFSISSSGNYVYLIRASNSNVYVNEIDAETQDNVNINAENYASVDGNQDGIDSVTLTRNAEGTELHAAWSSKNSDYPDSFNIRYVKGIIETDGSVTWQSPEQVTSTNETGFDRENPSIIVRHDGNPVILYDQYRSSNGSYWVTAHVYDGSSWSFNYVLSSTSYTQSSPSSLFVPQEINGLSEGRIWVAWHGKDSTDTTTDNIRISYSDDGGSGWSAMTKLTSGDTDRQQNASITANDKNEVMVVFNGMVGGTDNIRKIKNTNDAWGTVTDVTSNTSGYAGFPSTLFDPTLSLDFSEPLFIYEDREGGKVGFYGTWTTTDESPTTTATAVYTLDDAQSLGAFVQREGVVDVEAYLNDELMTSELDSDEYQFTHELGDEAPLELRLELSRTDTTNGDADRLTRILGGRG